MDLNSRDIFLRGEVIILKALTRDDAQNSDWYGWFNDKQLSKTLQKHYFPNTAEKQLKFWEENVVNASNKLQVGVCKKGDGNIIGITSLNNIDFINKKCEFSIVISE